jgi:hypothetical protein
MPLFLLFNTQTMHIKSLYTQQHCFPKNLIPWRDSNPGLDVPEADAMPTVTLSQGRWSDLFILNIKNRSIKFV